MTAAERRDLFVRRERKFRRVYAQAQTTLIDRTLQAIGRAGSLVRNMMMRAQTLAVARVR